MKQLLLHLIIISCFLLWGCSENPVDQNESQVSPSSGEIGQEPFNTIEPTNLSFDGTDAGRGYEDIFEPGKLEVCPSHSAARIEDMGIQSRYYLVVEPADSELYSGPWNLIGSKGELTRFRESVENQKENSSYGGISPDGSWIAYYLYTSEGSELWISSIEGTSQWMILDHLDQRFPFFWVSDKKIVIHKTIPRMWGYETWLQINPFTLGKKEVIPLFLELGWFDYSPDGNEIIYLDERDPSNYISLYNFGTGEKVSVFNTINEYLYRYQLSGRMHWTEFGISLARLKPGALEVTSPILKNQIAGEDIPLFRVVFPEDAATGSIGWWSNNHGFLTFRRTFPVGDLPFGASQDYFLDIQKRAYYEFCEEVHFSSGGIKVSPDEKYISWYVPEHEEFGAGSVVLEYETGQWGFIKDWRVLDWAVIEDQENARE